MGMWTKFEEPTGRNLLEGQILIKSESHLPNNPGPQGQLTDPEHCVSGQLSGRVYLLVQGPVPLWVKAQGGTCRICTGGLRQEVLKCPAQLSVLRVIFI
jgi:hypothetical protein